VKEEEDYDKEGKKMSSWCINEGAAIGNEQGKKGMETPLYRNF
jgi:hypothetical protein